MQFILWLGLIAATGVCVFCLAMIALDGRRKLKARRRTEHVRKWVQSETSVRARSAGAS